VRLVRPERNSQRFIIFFMEAIMQDHLWQPVFISLFSDYSHCWSCKSGAQSVKRLQNVHRNTMIVPEYSIDCVVYRIALLLVTLK
jgi:hypothetical protein